MFEVTLEDLGPILKHFGIHGDISGLVELERLHYEKNDPASREVRVVLKVLMTDGRAFVMRLRHEEDAPRELLDKQSRFADLLWANGVPVPCQYASCGSFVRDFNVAGYDVTATVEDFVEGEVRSVDEMIAEKAGALLARTHDVSERNRVTVGGRVLFDPFDRNDLFFYEEFRSIGDQLEGDDLALHRRIMERYEAIMDTLSPLRTEPRYAVQGDFSDCNLFLQPDGELGVFDFNRCGDNVLFCDAVMQAVFVARLMDYPEAIAGDSEKAILPAFLRGYQVLRPFDDQHRALFGPLYRLIDAFWAGDIEFDENSLLKELARGDAEGVHRHLTTIWRKLTSEPTPELPQKSNGMKSRGKEEKNLRKAEQKSRDTLKKGNTNQSPAPESF